MSYTLMQCGRQGVQSSLISLRLFTQRLCLHCKVLQHVMHWLVAGRVPYPISSKTTSSPSASCSSMKGMLMVPVSFWPQLYLSWADGCCVPSPAADKHTKLSQHPSAQPDNLGSLLQTSARSEK